MTGTSAPNSHVKALYEASLKLGDKMVAPDFTLILEGHEQMQLLTYSFPIPFPGAKTGSISFYETEQGHTWSFLARVIGRLLSGKIMNRDGLGVYALEGVSIELPKAAADWSEQKPLVVTAVMRWNSASRIGTEVAQ